MSWPSRLGPFWKTLLKLSVLGNPCSLASLRLSRFKTLIVTMSGARKEEPGSETHPINSSSSENLLTLLR